MLVKEGKEGKEPLAKPKRTFTAIASAQSSIAESPAQEMRRGYQEVDNERRRDRKITKPSTAKLATRGNSPVP